MKRKDYLEILRFTFAGVFLLSIIRKVFIPEFEISFRNFFTSLTPMLDYEFEVIWIGIITIEFFLVIGIFYEAFFNYSFLSAFILLSAGIVINILSLILHIQSNCGCGLFSDNPYLILFQKIALMTILIILMKNKALLFSYNKSG